MSCITTPIRAKELPDDTTICASTRPCWAACVIQAPGFECPSFLSAVTLCHVLRGQHQLVA
jgi:hypothetical protein